MIGGGPPTAPKSALFVCFVTFVDAPCRQPSDASTLLAAVAAMGYNVFNFSFEHGLAEMRQAAGPAVVLLGNIRPRDVLAQGTPEDVHRAVGEAIASLPDRRRWILSAGGGVPPRVPSENIEALCAAAG